MKVRLQWADRTLTAEFPAAPLVGDVVKFGEEPSDIRATVTGRRWVFDYYGSNEPPVLVVRLADA